MVVFVTFIVHGYLSCVLWLKHISGDILVNY